MSGKRAQGDWIDHIGVPTSLGKGSWSIKIPLISLSYFFIKVEEMQFTKLTELLGSMNMKGDQ